MKEIRIHGRGGQGAVLAEQILVAALVAEGKYAAGFPMFGAERRGAPVASFVRFDDMPIREKTQIYSPDCLIVLDISLISLSNTYSGMKPGGIIVLDSPNKIEEKPHQNVKIMGIVDASEIARAELGIPATNSCMLGAFSATTNWVTLDSIIGALKRHFTGILLEKNIRCAQRGFRETSVITKW